MPPEVDQRKVAQAYSHKQGTPSWVYIAMGMALGIMVVCLLYYVHSSRAAAELARHTEEAHDFLNMDHEELHDMSDEEHAKHLAKHGIHETDEDLRMHAKEFFEHDENKDAFHAGPDATKGEIESMDKNKDGAVSFLEYHDGFHNEKLKQELFHHYYGEIYGKGIPNHYHTERHPDAKVDHHEVHDMDKPLQPGDEDYKEPHEDPMDDHPKTELDHHLEELKKEEEAKKLAEQNKKK